MTPGETMQTLLVWTPFLAAGFAWNVGISVATMVIGTPVGLALARLRLSGSRIGALLTAASRLPPTFVLIFYFAYVLPAQFSVFGLVISLPGWLKASLALSVAVTGFVSDNALSSLRHLRRGEYVEALYFVPAWTSYFLIIVMASSTASVIGVPEIVYRANTLIAATGDVGATPWVYGYAMLWFLMFCWPLSRLMAMLRNRLEERGRDRSAGVEMAASEGRAGR